MGQYLFFLLIIACPLMMMFMMRGGHGHGGNAQGTGAPKQSSVDELHRQRAVVDEEIAAREGLKEADRARHAEHF